jgi:hypothetical protein
MVTPKGSMSTEGETLQVSVLTYRCSICPPLVTRQMSILESSSCHTRRNIWHSIAATASTILCRSCGKSCGIGGTYTRAPYTTWFTVCDRNLITRLTSAASPSLAISNTCTVGQKIGVSLPLLTCSPSAWPSRLLYRRGRKSRRDLRIALYICVCACVFVCMCVYIYIYKIAQTVLLTAAEHHSLKITAGDEICIWTTIISSLYFCCRYLREWVYKSDINVRTFQYAILWKKTRFSKGAYPRKSCKRDISITQYLWRLNDSLYRAKALVGNVKPETFMSSTFKGSANPDWYFMEFIRSLKHCGVSLYQETDVYHKSWHCVIRADIAS